MMKNLTKIAMVVALMTPLTAVAAEGDDKIATSKEYVDSGLSQKANKTTVDALDTAVETLGTSVGQLGTVVGDADGGLVKQVGDLETTTTGLATDVEALQDLVADLPQDTTDLQTKTNITQNILTGADVGSATKYTSAAAVNNALGTKQDTLTCTTGQMMYFTAAGTYECRSLATGAYTGD